MNHDKFTADVHQNAVEHGWWDNSPSIDDILVMIHCELSEAVEEFRNEKPMLYFNCLADGAQCNAPTCGHYVAAMLKAGRECAYCGAKPEGVAVELADVCLRIFDYLEQQSTVYFGHPWSRLKVAEGYTRCDRYAPDIRKKSFPALVNTCHRLLTNAQDSRNPKFLNETWLIAVYCGIKDWLEVQDISLDDVLVLKHEYNKTRPYRHGGKLI